MATASVERNIFDENSNTLAVMPKVLSLTRYPALLYCQYACVNTVFNPSGGNT